jgi:cytochrome c2
LDLRAAVLTVLLPAACAGCLRQATPARGGRCVSCHAVHEAHLGDCGDCHRGDPAAARKELAHARLLTGRAAASAFDGPAVRAGDARVRELACRRCHRIAGSGNRLAADLGRTAGGRTQAQLVASIRTPVASMPRFGLDRGQAEEVIAFLLHHQDRGDALESQRVRFAAEGQDRASVFEDRCGGCHRMLGPSGPLGRSGQGPDLSGIASPFHPPTAAGDRPWTPSALDEWLRNPRAIRPTATMRPVLLDEEEQERLLAELGFRGEELRR